MIFSFWNKLHLFRADNSYHKVSKIEEGERTVFSIGIYPQQMLTPIYSVINFFVKSSVYLLVMRQLEKDVKRRNFEKTGNI